MSSAKVTIVVVSSPSFLTVVDKVIKGIVTITNQDPKRIISYIFLYSSLG